jgi:FKBP-type peptidyl-prolyl cis-trans isomerase
MASAAQTAIDTVQEAVLALKDWRGSSRQALVKYCSEKKKLDKAQAAKLVADGIKAGVAAGVLVQDKQSVTVKGVAFEKPADITVVVETLAPGDTASRQAKAGDTIRMKYEGRLLDGTVFDSASSFTFELGGGEVIKGWDEGIVGCRVGEQRRLTIPPKLGA